METVNIEVLNKRLKTLESRVQEVEIAKSPFNIQGRIDYLYGQINDLSISITEIVNKLNAFAKEDKFIELFPDSDIKEMYFASNLTTAQIKDYIEKHILGNGENISLSTVSRYTNGHVEDLKVRSQLGRYLRHAIIKNRKNKSKD